MRPGSNKGVVMFHDSAVDNIAVSRKSGRGRSRAALKYRTFIP